MSEWRDIDDKFDVQIKELEKQVLTNQRSIIQTLKRLHNEELFTSRKLDKEGEITQELSELKKTIINNNISFDKEIKELKEQFQLSLEVYDMKGNHKEIQKLEEVLRELFEEFAINYDSGNWTKWRDFFMKLREKLGGEKTGVYQVEGEHEVGWVESKPPSRCPLPKDSECTMQHMRSCMNCPLKNPSEQAILCPKCNRPSSHHIISGSEEWVCLTEEVTEPFKPRFEVRRGKFGLYFYDNELRKDLDLHEVIIKLRKLQIYEEGTHDHFSTSEKILVEKEALEFLFNWNPEFMSLDEIKRYNQLKEKYLKKKDHD